MGKIEGLSSPFAEKVGERAMKLQDEMQSSPLLMSTTFEINAVCFLITKIAELECRLELLNVQVSDTTMLNQGTKS